MKRKKQYLFVLFSFGLLLLVLAVLFTLLPNRPDIRFSALETHRIVTPTPGTAQQDTVEAQTPRPTAQHIIRTPKPVLPDTAVNLLSDGNVLFALDSRETAERLVRTYYQQCAYENIDENSTLLKATLVSSVSVARADGTAEYLSFDDALNKLLKNRSMISVQRTVERATVTLGSVQTKTERTYALPHGSRFYRKLGAPSRTLTVSEIYYKNGFAASETETQNLQIYQGSPRSVLEGTYTGAHPDREPGSKEGRMGKSKGAIRFTFPVRGTIVSYFGMRYHAMHNGVDFLAGGGARILAPADGTVIFCGERPGYGFVIDIRHENGFVSRLAPCANVAVELEQHVSRGSVIAYTQPAEGRENPILHYELLIDGIPYNPQFYLPQ